MEKSYIFSFIGISPLILHFSLTKIFLSFFFKAHRIIKKIHSHTALQVITKMDFVDYTILIQLFRQHSACILSFFSLLWNISTTSLLHMSRIFSTWTLLLEIWNPPPLLSPSVLLAIMGFRTFSQQAPHLWNFFYITFTRLILFLYSKLCWKQTCSRLFVMFGLGTLICIFHVALREELLVCLIY